MEKIPFKDEDAAEKFETYLIFAMTDGSITELDLRKDIIEEPNPFLDRVDLETHLFITDYDERAKPRGDSLVYSWKLRDTYPCSLYEVN